MTEIISFDSIGVIVLSGIVLLLFTMFFKPTLLKGLGWVEVFSIGGSFYVIISSLYFAITGLPFWNDDINFYRFVIALGAIIYIGVILDFYGLRLPKKSLFKKK